MLALSTVKLANGNTGNSQGIGIFLCCFPKCPIIYPVGPVYYFPGNLYKTISSCDLNFMLVNKRIHLNLLNIVIFLTLKVILGDLPTRIVNVKPQRDRNIIVPTIYALSK